MHLDFNHLKGKEFKVYKAYKTGNKILNELYGDFKLKKWNVTKGNMKDNNNLKKIDKDKSKLKSTDLRDDLSDFLAADEEFEDVLHWGK